MDAPFTRARPLDDLLEQEGPCAWHAFPMGTSSGYLRVRVRGAAEELVPALTEMVRELGTGVAVTEQQSAEAFLRDMIGSHRVAAVTSTGLAYFDPRRTPLAMGGGGVHVVIHEYDGHGQS